MRRHFVVAGLVALAWGAPVAAQSAKQNRPAPPRASERCDLTAWALRMWPTADSQPRTTTIDPTRQPCDPGAQIFRESMLAPVTPAETISSASGCLPKDCPLGYSRNSGLGFVARLLPATLMLAFLGLAAIVAFSRRRSR
jgi:hypothetical protein